jgi:hypothetical protein
MRGDNTISEARAKIIWGESSLSVRDFLVASGMDSAGADKKVREFNLERNRELRKIGFRDILIGTVVIGIAGIPFYIEYHLNFFNRFIAVVFPAVLYGLWKLAIGTIYLVRPQLVHKSISNIGEYDILD